MKNLIILILFPVLAFGQIGGGIQTGIFLTQDVTIEARVAPFVSYQFLEHRAEIGLRANMQGILFGTASYNCFCEREYNYPFFQLQDFFNAKLTEGKFAPHIQLENFVTFWNLQRLSYGGGIGYYGKFEQRFSMLFNVDDNWRFEYSIYYRF